MTVFCPPWQGIEPYASQRPYCVSYDSGPCPFWCSDHRVADAQTCFEFPDFDCDDLGIGPDVFHGQEFDDGNGGTWTVLGLDVLGNPLPPQADLDVGFLTCDCGQGLTVTYTDGVRIVHSGDWFANPNRNYSMALGAFGNNNNGSVSASWSPLEPNEDPQPLFCLDEGMTLTIGSFAGLTAASYSLPTFCPGIPYRYLDDGVIGESTASLSGPGLPTPETTSADCCLRTQIDVDGCQNELRVIGTAERAHDRFPISQPCCIWWRGFRTPFSSPSGIGTEVCATSPNNPVSLDFEIDWRTWNVEQLPHYTVAEFVPFPSLLANYWWRQELSISVSINMTLTEFCLG